MHPSGSTIQAVSPAFALVNATATANRSDSSKGSITSVTSVELMCGAAGVSAELRKGGIDAIGVDWVRNACSKPKAPVMQADCSDPNGQRLTLDLLENGNVEYAHAAPPCGTASRARERPLPKKLIREGCPAPRQLRSDAYPEGLPGLITSEQLRVTLSNKIYAFVLVCILLMHNSGKLWTLENPLTSYLWLYPGYAALLATAGVYSVEFQQCNHGGTRPVWRRWATNIPGLSVLAGKCNNNHVHEAFGVHRPKDAQGPWRFDTAKEAEYPLELCKKVAGIVLQAIVSKGYIPLPDSLSTADEHPVTKRLRLRASVGLFVRGNRLPPALSEYSEVIQLPLPAEPPAVGTTFQLQDKRTGRVLRHEPAKGVNSGSSELYQGAYLAVGVFRTPQQFADEAALWRHPIDLCTATPDIVKRNLFWQLTTSREDVAKFRLGQLRKLRTLLPTFEAKEVSIRARCSPQMLKVLEGKKLELLRYILQQADYPDIQVVDDVLNGMPLVGPMPGSGVFPRKVRAAQITPQQLRSSSRWTRAAILGKVRSSNDASVDQAVWAETLLEIDKGWLTGPYNQDQVNLLLGNDWIASRRFGIRQGDKIRTIDDYSESQANSSVSMFEKIELMGVDDFVAVVKIAAESTKPDGSILLTLDSGEQLSGLIPAGTSVDDALRWTGKTVDLKAAYRQIPTRPSESWAAVIAVYDPANQCTQLCLQHALPFGAVGSVCGFNRAARALWAAASFWLRLAWTNFYDDYPTAELERNSTAADIAIRTFLLLLGWDMSTDAKKCKPFNQVFDVLGTVVDLSQVGRGSIIVRNKETRVQAISSQIDAIVKDNFLSSPVTAELRGKCQYAANQLFGRIAVGPLRVLGDHQFHSKTRSLTTAVLEALSRLKHLLNHGLPRELKFRGEQRPILIFSDGACEGQQRESVTVGAVVIDTVDRKAFMFGMALQDRLVDDWKSEGKVQTIGQAEILPVLLVKLSFESLLRHRRCCFFLDNDSARMGIIKGGSPSLSSERMIQAIVATEQTSQCWAWYGRVPSPSNPGDGPSRLRLSPSEENCFAKLVEVQEPPESIYAPRKEVG